ncbi:hypothetical protein NDU88_003942 [Pleurodeles waltl]|uniref:Uncharacterized protein n=1 Tax=Pleurodeles waltl TaxID=8319 RepID=A0AAV7UHQ0_PLEWA|nr:hypothetical protein NDU88_003942 [Pleurodeles waltl]
MPPSGILPRRQYRDSVTEPHRVAARSRTLPEAARARTCPQTLGTMCVSAPARPQFRVSVSTVPSAQHSQVNSNFKMVIGSVAARCTRPNEVEFPFHRESKSQTLKAVLLSARYCADGDPELWPRWSRNTPCSQSLRASTSPRRFRKRAAAGRNSVWLCDAVSILPARENSAGRHLVTFCERGSFSRAWALYATCVRAPGDPVPLLDSAKRAAVILPLDPSLVFHHR